MYAGSQSGAMANDRQRNADGTFASAVGPKTVLDTMDVGEPYSAREIADQLDIPRRTAHKYLSELADAEKVRKKKFDERTVVWLKQGGTANPPGCPECDRNENGLFTQRSQSITHDYECAKCGHRWGNTPQKR